MGGMKIGVIAAEMEGRRTGVGRYLEGMLRGLERWDHGGEWHLFFQGGPFNSPVAESGPAIPHFSGLRGSRVLWEQVLVTRELARVFIPNDLDLWRLTLDGDAHWKRLTRLNRYQGYGVSNSAVSPDGRHVVFQLRRSDAPPGNGLGLMLLDLEALPSGPAD